VGIIALVLGEGNLTLVFGVLVISFTSAAIGSSVIVAVFLGRRARTARLQADLLANVTHELRTPLSAIRMYAQTLEMGLIDGNPEQQKRCVNTIIRETEWLEAMIDRALTWRSLAKDRADLDLVLEPIDDVVVASAQRFQRMTTREEVNFTLEVKSRAPVWHDKRGIGSIVLNLLFNAWKYTGEDKQISLEVKDEDDRVLISVMDNGIGIPQKEIPRIFEPFYRVDSRLRGRSPGAGLGLAIVSHLVHAHSGSLEVDSTEGKGSKFEIFLPIPSKA
jgi:two-component system phosphate regulon sensor histidine kinase PhoR